MNISLIVLASLFTSFVLQSILISSVGAEDHSENSDLNDTSLEETSGKLSLPWMAQSNKVVSEWFSQENGGMSQQATRPIYGVECSGSFCNKKRWTSSGFAKYDLTSQEGMWTAYINDAKHPKMTTCPPNTVVSKFHCTGSNCHTLRMYCSMLPDAYKTGFYLIEYSKEFSQEEGKAVYCPSSHYLGGMGCSGKNCDKITLVCVKIFEI